MTYQSYSDPSTTVNSSGSTFLSSDAARTTTVQNKLDLQAELEKIRQQALALKSTIDAKAATEAAAPSGSTATAGSVTIDQLPKTASGTPNSTGYTYDPNTKLFTPRPGFTPPVPVVPAAPANPYDELITTQQTDITNQLNQIQNQEYDPLTRQVLQQINDSYNLAIQRQQQLNKASEQATTTRGFRLGTAQYSPDLAAQELTATVNDGVKAIADLQNQMNQALNKAKQADMDKKYETLNKEMDNLRSLQKEKANKVFEMNAKTQELLAKHQEEEKNAQAQAALQTKALAEIQNGNTDAADIFKKVNYNTDGTLVANPLLPKDIQALIDAKTGNKAGTQRILTDAEAKKFGLPKGSAISIAEAQSLGLMPKVGEGIGGDDNKLLSVTDAQNLGVPYGTTVGQARKMGKTPSDLSSTTKTMIEAAPNVITFVDKINKEIADAESGLGPIASRWKEFKAGKIGFSDPAFTALRTNVGLLTTLLMRMHVGARGGEYIMKHFTDLIDVAKQSPENLRAALNEIKDYANSLISEGKGGNQTPQTTTVQVNGQTYNVGQVYQDGSGVKWTVDANGKWTKQL